MTLRYRSAAVAAVACASLAGTLSAQSAYTGPANFVFSMEFTTWSDAAIGFDHAAAEMLEEAVITYSPGHDPFARPLVDYSTWSTFLGDEDNDGSYTDTIITEIHACWVRPGAPCPPSIHDVYLSIATDTGTNGALGGAVIDDGDVFRILPSGAIETFLSVAQIHAALGGTTSITSLDVNGFTVDPATGDLYMTFTAGVDVNGTPAADDAVVRIPASGFTTVAGPLTPVATMTPGVAEVVATSADVDAMFLNAGLDGITDLMGIEIDPAGGTYTSPSTGLTMPNLWLADDDSSDEAIVSTADDGTGTRGVVPTVNGAAVDASTSLGLANPGAAGFSPGSWTALAFQTANASGTALHLDVDAQLLTTPGTLDLDVSGEPNEAVIVLGELFNTRTMGGFVPRLSSLPFSATPQSWVTPFIITANGPAALVILDGEGFGRYTLSVGAVIPAGEMVVWQALSASLTVSSPTQTITN